MLLKGPLRKIALIYTPTSDENAHFPTLSPALLSLRGKKSLHIWGENSISQSSFHFWLLIKLNIFYDFGQTILIFMLKETRGHLLPFLFSIASNGTRGFLMFPSSVKEFLQMQYQTTLDQCTQQNSWKLHLTHYLFFPVWTQLFWWTQRKTFWISFL